MRLFSLCFLFAFPFLTIAQNLYFPPNFGDDWETISLAELGWCEDKLDELLDLVEDKNSKAFIVLKDGKIVIEEYFGDFDQTKNHQWNSAAKALTATLVGLAQEDGLLNISNKTSDYLGKGWTILPEEKEDLITIRHQLTMTSGIRSIIGDNCNDPDCLHYQADAGTRWSYHNPPYTLLRNVIESTTSENYNTHTRQRLLDRIGMNGFWLWIGENNVFFSTPRSMARFGLLALAGGDWNGQTIISDKDYLNAMSTPSQTINNAYGYLWWLNGTENYMLPGSQIVFQGEPTSHAPDDIFSGLGKNGQYLDVVPSQNIVVVRMGESPDNALVPIAFHNEIWEKLNELMCNTSSSEELNIDFNFENSVFPNPFSNAINFKDSVESVKIFNLTGQLVFQQKNILKLNTGFLPKGIYFLKIIDKSGKKLIQKISKN